MSNRPAVVSFFDWPEMVTTNPLDAVADLQAAVAQLAPTLRPQVLPKGVQYGLDVLLSLCKSEQQKMALRNAVDRHAPVDAEETGRGAYAIGAFDIARRVFSVEKIAWLTEEEALVHEFPRFIELQLQDAEQATKITELFLTQNGHDISDVMLAQQCFNAAFALQTLLRAFPRPPIAINGCAIEMDESTDVETVIANALFAKKTKSTKADKSPSQQKSSKSKKRKATSTQ